MTKENIFEFDRYRDYLTQVASAKGPRGGVKSQLAKAMGSHLAYLSRVFGGQANLSLEQAEKIAAYLNLSQDEKRYFFYLVEEERAGTQALKEFFARERQELRKKNLNLSQRVPCSGQIQLQDQATYYGAWYYAALNVMAEFEDLQDIDLLAQQMGLSPQLVRDALTFLESLGLIQGRIGKYKMTQKHIHLDASSPLIRQHHLNWRVKAMQSLDAKGSDDLHYSGVLGLSAADAARLKEKLAQHLAEYIGVATQSRPEQAYVYCFDFFRLG